MAKKPYDILKVREYTSKKTGEVRNNYTRVGVAFEIESGGMSIEIEEGISITGRAVILPRKDRAEDDGPEASE